MSHPESELNRVLYQLRSEHQGIEAPAFLEERLAQETRLNASSKASLRRSWMQGWAWGLGFALVAIASTVAWWLSIHASSHPSQQIAANPVPAAHAPAIEPVVTASQAVTQREMNARHVARISSKPSRSSAQHSQVEDSLVATTSFLPLPVSEGLPEPAQQSVVRTRILTSSLAQYGLDVPATLQPQLVSAEFLVGEDGLPRAIRFVR
jgi:hypothetical protein